MSDRITSLVSDAPLNLSGSILAAPESQRLTYATVLYQCGAWIHVDIVDESYPIGKAVSPQILDHLNNEHDKVEIHLMVRNPLAWVEKLMKYRPRRIVVQVEDLSPTLDASISEFEKAQELAHANNVDLWIGFAPQTLPAAASELVGKADGVLQMLSNPGTAGTVADFGLLKRIAPIEKPRTVDGGVKLSSLQEIAQVGIGEAIIGRDLWRYVNQYMDS
ncbi:hypothetical protein OZX73_08610 [Bifidobacterium sp. ESL0775]|uniref:hypothetical protein n=1 Tax=Bifidobacterium sp. ESL0775 TaxID=2983230 RepID=UPI0023F7417D|nr:hypothetical protein [Bifidobacterium sp. ESL0775]WEV69302.1 hypothetical protein OZX73_08610 [Bifidobacterium sp. ESL0775]